MWDIKRGSGLWSAAKEDQALFRDRADRADGSTAVLLPVEVSVDLADAPHLRINHVAAVPPAPDRVHASTASAVEGKTQTRESALERALERSLDGSSGATRGLRAQAYRLVKRATDIVVSSVLIAVLSPVLLVTAAAVRITSRGPVLFGHERRGRNAAAIRVLKFRTMVDGAENMLPEMEQLAQAGHLDAVDSPVFKAPDDPRITAVGRVLRRTNIDELPQLFNVLAGDMSLVGPRPLVAKEVETLSPRVRDLRHRVRPGITGLWQVSRTEDMSFAERVDLDLLYVRRRSTRLDMLLLALTPLAVIRGNGSY